MITSQERLDQFRDAVLINGGREHYLKVPTPNWLAYRLGKYALFDPGRTDIFDTVDLVEVNDSRWEIKNLSRLYAPCKLRGDVIGVLEDMGVFDNDMYKQWSSDEKLYAQLSLCGDPEFRKYAATRRLMDGTPPEPGGYIREISEEELNQAVYGAPYAPIEYESNPEC